MREPQAYENHLQATWLLLGWSPPSPPLLSLVEPG